ncbi:hypothetical protein Enr13x_37090 [Stieleria neptunia]|uniref:Uncharacterized protein n=1 Tax=Stieleria neptunia TaxID=2527979 RepID=A0A518HSL8_9BACT|nr:hypothetical protein Enr13x_37090 [Stieleria neptunia]
MWQNHSSQRSFCPHRFAPITKLRKWFDHDYWGRGRGAQSYREGLVTSSTTKADTD